MMVIMNVAGYDHATDHRTEYDNRKYIKRAVRGLPPDNGDVAEEKPDKNNDEKY